MLGSCRPAAIACKLQSEHFPSHNSSRTLPCPEKALPCPALACPLPRPALPGQLALAWVLSRGEDVVPIPGCRREKHLLENLGASTVILTRHELAVLEEALDAHKWALPACALLKLHANFEVVQLSRGTAAGTWGQPRLCGRAGGPSQAGAAWMLEARGQSTDTPRTLCNG